MRTRALWLAAPILAGLPAAVGIATTIFRVIQSPWPSLGWPVAISSDAGSFLLGGAPYGNPATDYTGQLYTPFYPLAISLIDRVWFWEGWPLLLSICGGALAVVVVARVASRPMRDRNWTTIAAAAAVGALAWSLVYCLDANVLYQGRADQLAWALAIAGVVAWHRGVTAGGAGRIVSPLLLTLAFWTKQSTGIALVTVLAWSVWWLARRGPRARVTAVAMVGGTAALNAVIAVVFEITSNGWQRVIEFELPQDYARPTSFAAALGEFASHAGLAIALALALTAAAMLSTRDERDTRPGFGALLATFAVATALSAAWFREIVGAEDNQFVGAVWALGLVVADRWRVCGGTPAARAVAGAAIAVVALSTALPASSTWSLRRHEFVPKARVATVPAEVRAFFATHDVYNGELSDLAVQSRGTVYPHSQALKNLLWGGRRPGFMLERLLARKFEYVYPLTSAYDSSGAGRYEANWFWKVNQVIHSKYELAPDTPTLPGESFADHAWRRRAGADPAPWLARCFGPLRLAGRLWDIHDGGGLWCARRDGRGVSMLGTPAHWTELRTRRPVNGLGGMLQITLPAGRGAWRVSFGSWRISATTAQGSADLELRANGEAVVFRRRRTIRLRFVSGGAALLRRGDTVEVRARATPDARLSLWTTRGSRARFRVDRLSTL